MTGKEGWWRCPSAEEIRAYWDSDEAHQRAAESIVAAIERMEMEGLADTLPPRSDGMTGLTAYLRTVFAPAFERVYAKRRAAEANRGA